MVTPNAIAAALAPNNPSPVTSTPVAKSESSPSLLNGQRKAAASWLAENGSSSPRCTFSGEANPPHFEQISSRASPVVFTPVQSAQRVAPQALQRHPASD